MKKFTALILSLVVLLCGCSSSELFVNRFANEKWNDAPTSTSSSLSSSSSSSSSSSPGSSFPTSSSSSTPQIDHPLNGILVGNRGTNLSLRSNGNLGITRINRATATDGPSDNMWTVFVYICGTNLESEARAATNNLTTMQTATRSCSRLRFVVEAGGCEKWNNTWCTNGKNTRLLISGGNVTKLDTFSANMGNPNTLVNFLDWGLSNYRSQYSSLILWDHGGATASGVCFDELYKDKNGNKDSLSIKELDIALAKVYEKHRAVFELVTFNACLMATVETANVMVPYAKYMMASEEVSYTPWYNFTVYSTYLNSGKNDGGELGKQLVQNYFTTVSAGVARTFPGQEKALTMSVIDLSALDSFLVAFNSYCADIYDYICNKNGLNNFLTSVKSAGSFNASDEFNSSDIRRILVNTSSYSSNANRAVQLLDKCIVYMKNGELYSDVGGLSIYYPTKRMKSSDVANLKDICISPYYMSIIDINVYGSSKLGSISGYDMSYWIGQNSGYWSDNSVAAADFSYWDSDDDGSINTDISKSAISLKQGPHSEMITIDGETINAYGITVTNNTLDYVQMVYGELYQLNKTTTGRQLYIDIGHEITIPIDNGFYAYLDDKWAGLPNGQALCNNVVSEYYNEETDSADFICSAPIYLNGELTNLIYIDRRYSSDPFTPEYYIIGVNAGKDDSGAAALTQSLETGDVVIPAYPGYDVDTLEFIGYFKAPESYTVPSSGLKIGKYTKLNSGDYLYTFMMRDIYGNDTYTEIIPFEW